jgi:hypothetical protein
MEKKKTIVKGLELLNDLKNEAALKREGQRIKLAFSKPVKISDTEVYREFEFRIPTLEDIEIALSAVEGEDGVELKSLKQTYYLISSQFEPKIAPDDIPKHLRIDEMKAFSEVLEPFLG